LGNAQPSVCPHGVPSGVGVDVAAIIQAANKSAERMQRLSPRTTKSLERIAREEHELAAVRIGTLRHAWCLKRSPNNVAKRYKERYPTRSRPARGAQRPRPSNGSLPPGAKRALDTTRNRY
jgi:hypothetical protein